MRYVTALFSLFFLATPALAHPTGPGFYYDPSVLRGTRATQGCRLVYLRDPVTGKRTSKQAQDCNEYKGPNGFLGNHDHSTGEP